MRLCSLPFPALSDGLSADAPVVGLDFFNDHACGLRVLSQNILKHPGHFLDKLLFLFGSGAFFRDLDIELPAANEDSYRYLQGISILKVRT